MAAKFVLACSILYGVTFASLLLFFYDDYCQDVRAHKPFRYSLNEALRLLNLDLLHRRIFRLGIQHRLKGTWPEIRPYRFPQPPCDIQPCPTIQIERSWSRQ